jgi:molybdopterin molybdotransferase
VTFLILVRPALLKLRGLQELDLPKIDAEASEDFVNHGDRLHFMRGRLERRDAKWLVTPLPRQGSHVISSLANANCLVAVPEAETVKRGAVVTVLVID